MKTFYRFYFAVSADEIPVGEQPVGFIERVAERRASKFMGGGFVLSIVDIDEVRKPAAARDVDDGGVVSYRVQVTAESGD